MSKINISEEFTMSNRVSNQVNTKLLEKNGFFKASIFLNIANFFSDNFSGGSDAAGFVSFTAATIGYGMILLPYNSTHSGLIWSVVQLIICGLISYYALLTQIKCASSLKVCSYQELAEHSFGKGFRWLTNLTIFIGNGGVVVFYFQTIFTLLEIFILQVSGIDIKNFITNGEQKLITLAIGLVISLPICLPKHLKKLRYFWLLNLGFSIFICVVVIQQAFLYQDIENNLSFLLKPNFSGFTQTFPSIIFAMCHYNVLEIFGQLTFSSKKIMVKVIGWSTLFVFTVYLLIMVFGYITFTNTYLNPLPNSNQLFLVYGVAPGGNPQNYPIGILACIVLMCLMLTWKLPVFVLPAKDSIQDIFYPRKCDKFGQPIDIPIAGYLHFIFVASTVLCCATLACFVPSIIKILNIISSSFWVLHYFVFPAIFYLKLPREEHKTKHLLMSALLLVTMTGFACFTTYENASELLN